jgi:hypothetical protein
MRQDVLCGEMKGRRDLKTEDPGLQEEWIRLKERYGGAADSDWKEEIRKALTRSGYEVIFYE